MNKILRGLLVAGLIAIPALAHADDDDDAPRRPGAPAAEHDEGIDTEDIFGFTTGTDTGEKGEKQATLTLDGRFSKYGGSYGALTGTAEFEYSLTDNFKFALGGAWSAFNIKNVLGFDNFSGGGINGAFFEMKYRFLDHRTSPIGLSLSIEPEFALHDETSGEETSAYGIEFRLAADAELVKDKLFFAANLVYVPEWEREHEEADDEEALFGRSFWAKSSGLEVSGALTWQAVKDVFIGGEVRYLSAYEGNFLNSQNGWGVFVGPSIYAQLTKDAYVKAAWSVQVAGDTSEAPWSSNLDLVNFERQQFRVSAGFEF